MSELPEGGSRPDGLSGVSPEGGAQAQRVLVVDDYADNRELYSMYLEMQGFEVQTAENGAEALECARASNPDVILMDLSLPVMSGWDAIRELKADPRTGAIPVIALTGHAMATHIERAREAGADDFAAKPCIPSDVEQKIRDLLKGSSLGSKAGD
ncbi:response regulator [Pyxidicoccus fallax]|uniref:Response regulator n=1 Tax=Pyxidicoccus fallax TaxID=394095 RepID=A0A848LIR4_9BACT|nr:response regulator [Pyxidicoccus fallax]NMO17612.1 response regulator [Pyxidicoccus fallax]NPC80172.1 response regulator [Pyxidicoccus fallax]